MCFSIHLGHLRFSLVRLKYRCVIRRYFFHSINSFLRTIGPSERGCIRKEKYTPRASPPAFCFAELREAPASST